MQEVSRNAIEAAGRWLGNLETLCELTLEGRWENVQHCVFKGITLHHIHHLLLYLTSPAGEDLFSLIPPTFPALRVLNIQVQWNARADPSPKFRVSDLTGLGAHPMKKITLYNLPLRTSSDDIPILLSTWPLLETIILVPDEAIRSGFVFNAKLVLAQASRLGTRFKRTALRLDFTSLVTAPTTSLPPSHSPLQRLTLFPSSTVIPESWKDKLKLVVNLLTLFPQLVSIDMISLTDNDLQSILDVFQELLSSPPRKYGHLSLK
ncbi:hypothetical protein D9756_008513 [Leucocoprinus leucothites]|uniref:Uncharacterized protein n=1 Tax=Leucocoprinus leucothites TaxID=201217 RepID=A0A8H5CZ07_9AGAR|nr:hypothetical protein D9756_008513 [Leucoagaricus leucothites]